MMKSAHELDHIHGFSTLWELRTIPDTRPLRNAVRAAGSLLMLFASAHLTSLI
jgi:hypothetical protein